MNIHISLMAQTALKYANGLPLFLVGDFNT